MWLYEYFAKNSYSFLVCSRPVPYRWGAAFRSKSLFLLVGGTGIEPVTPPV
jgi:hypothetical protein